MTQPAKSTHTQPLQRKTIVITGASSGAGRAIALEFARYKTNLVLAARSAEALAEVVAECEAYQAKAIAVKTDVTNAGEVKELAQAAASFGGRIDVWVNNAGVLAAGEFARTPIAVHDQVIRTNLMGYLHGAHAVLPYFKQQQYGILINNISVGGWFPTPYAVGYSASKFGLRGFSEALRGELHQWPHIHVCNVFPAFLDTPGMQHAANFTGKYVKPAPPVYDPQRVAKAVVNLAQYPKNEVTVGSVATILKLVYSVFPKLSRSITAGVMETYFKSAPSLPVTDGNLFAPVDYGTSIYGGWNSQADQDQRKKLVKRALMVAGIAAGILLLQHKSD